GRRDPSGFPGGAAHRRGEEHGHGPRLRVRAQRTETKRHRRRWREERARRVQRAVSMTAPRDVGVVIVAAGGSTRTSGSELKQFRWVAGKPMLLHSLQTFMARPDVVSVVCVIPREFV